MTNILVYHLIGFILSTLLFLFRMRGISSTMGERLAAAVALAFYWPVSLMVVIFIYCYRFFKVK